VKLSDIKLLYGSGMGFVSASKWMELPDGSFAMLARYGEGITKVCSDATPGNYVIHVGTRHSLRNEQYRNLDPIAAQAVLFELFK
jgi:hypothetical protein